MKRKRLASVVFFGSLAGLGLIVVGVLFGGAFFEAAWVGNFPLTVTIDNTTDSEVQRLECCAFVRREVADAYVDGNRGDPPRPCAIIEPYAGQPIELTIPTAGRGERSRVQCERLVVIAHWDDGTEMAKCVRIPDGRKSRSLTVVLP